MLISRGVIFSVSICLERDILYMYRTQIHVVKNMLEILVFASWLSLTAYAVWYSTVAKHYAPIAPHEAKILWKIHKQNVQCASKKWRAIRRGKKIIGFECECGFKHIQKRPIVANAPTSTIKSQNTKSSTLNRLNTTYKPNNS